MPTGRPRTTFLLKFGLSLKRWTISCSLRGRFVSCQYVPFIRFSISNNTKCVSNHRRERSFGYMRCTHVGPHVMRWSTEEWIQGQLWTGFSLRGEGDVSPGISAFLPHLHDRGLISSSTANPPVLDYTKIPYEGNLAMRIQPRLCSFMNKIFTFVAS